MKEKVLFITDFFGPNPGGIENFHTGIVQKWLDEDLILICFDSILYVNEEELNNFNNSLQNIILYRFPIKEKNYFSSRENIKSFISLFETLKKNYNIKHILLGNISLYTWLTMPYIVDSGIPYSIILHPVDLETLSFYKRNLIKYLRKAKQIFIYTNYFYEIAQIKGIPREILVQIPFGLFLRWNQNNLKVDKSLKELVKKNKNKINILTIGPLTKNKNIQRIIYILEHLQKKIDLKNIHWNIVGTGSEYHYLHEMIRVYNFNEIVTLTGFLNNKEVGYMYYNSDIYYHPGGRKNDIFSGFSTTLLEASFCALPVISGTGAAIEDIIQNNINGFIVQNENYEELSNKILEVAENTELGKKIGRMAEEKILREFTIERSVLNIYERIYI